MNSMFDRLGSFLRSYLDKENDDIFSDSETDDNLFEDEEEEPVESGWHYTSGNSYTGNFDYQKEEKTYTTDNSAKSFYQNFKQAEKPKAQIIPSKLFSDFIRLGLKPGASLDACKKAQKKLLKLYHPDKFISDVVAQKKATEMASLINASFQRIQIWYQTGKIE